MGGDLEALGDSEGDSSSSLLVGAELPWLLLELDGAGAGGDLELLEDPPEDDLGASEDFVGDGGERGELLLLLELLFLLEPPPEEGDGEDAEEFLEEGGEGEGDLEGGDAPPLDGDELLGDGDGAESPANATTTAMKTRAATRT